MSATVALGLVLALICSVVAILGFLYKQRGAADAPPVEWRHPWRSTKNLFANKWWTLGILVAMAGWVFHAAALGLAPISLVQATIAGGLALLTVVANKLFGFTIHRREWIGVALTAVGLTLLAATMGSTASSSHSDYAVGELALYAGLLTAAAIGCVAMVRAEPPSAGPVMAAAAGLLWGASDICIKAGTGHLLEFEKTIPLAIVITILSLAGLVVSARSLQIGPVVPVIAITSAAANVVSIAAGPVVFGEPMPDTAGGTIIRAAAFALVCLAAALTPGPRDPTNAQGNAVAPGPPATART